MGHKRLSDAGEGRSASPSGADTSQRRTDVAGGPGAAVHFAEEGSRAVRQRRLTEKQQLDIGPE